MKYEHRPQSAKPPYGTTNPSLNEAVNQQEEIPHSYSLRSTLYALRSTLYALRPTPYALRPTLYALLRSHPGLVLALIIYLGLALCYFFITPIFEAPDEWTHTLKKQANPHASLGYALDPGNKNNFLHTPAENFPYHGLALTVHILRLYSMIYGLIALSFTYLTAFEAVSGVSQLVPCHSSPVTRPLSLTSRFATFVALFVACQPMFAFITASVANEPANIAFCAMGLWLAQRYVLFGPTPQWGRAVALGLVLGLISLSKMTGLSFGLVVAVAFLITAVAIRKKPGVAPLLWRDSFIIALLTLVVGGWWYWRNYQLYGDFFQRGLYKIYFNIEQQPLTLREFLYTLSTGEVSFWATFGWLNIVTPEWVYSVYRIISRVGLLGVVLVALIPLVHWVSQRVGESANPQGKCGEWRTKSHLPSSILHPPSSITPLILHLVFPVALAFSLTRLVAIEGGLQGRQLLPALGSIAIVIIWGWWALSPARLRLGILMVIIAVMFGLAAWLPFAVVAPEYFPKPLLSEADLPADLNRLDLTYRNELKLVGIKIGAAVVRPGERVPVTAYWQALKPTASNYSVFVHLNGRGYQTVGQFNTYPGLGLRPTRALQPGQIVADTYPVLVDGGAAAPTRLLVNMGLFDFNEPGRPGIEAIGPNGQPASSTAGQLKLVPNQWPAYNNTIAVAEFADNIWLTDYAIIGCQFQTHPCEITFTWLARGKPSADYTVFIQLWQKEAKIRGFDAPPLAGDYPTSLWASGEVILDPHDLDLSAVPLGDYQILAGLYHLTTGDRLPASAGGTPLPNYVVDIGTLNLE
ncbi:MAG: hypothetical protein HYR94_07925 [Chloroflexi bacterium]|nr:hypothetical protein [Chloroflexota bacterium]